MHTDIQVTFVSIFPPTHMGVNMNKRHTHTHTHTHTYRVNIWKLASYKIPSKSTDTRDLGENRAVMLTCMTSWKNPLTFLIESASFMFTSI